MNKITNSHPPPKPTIAHVLHRLDLAGAELLAADLARELQGQYNFVFLCLDEVGKLGKRLQSEGFTVIGLGRKPGIDLPLTLRLRKLIRRYHITLLHAHQYSPFAYAALARLPRQFPPILFTEHGRHYPDPRKPKRLVANKFLLKPGDRITAVGQFVKRALVDREGLPAKRIDVIHNGIDPDRFAPNGQTNPNTLRSTLNLPPSAPLVLQIARFHPVKDHATALHAFTRTRQTLPNAHLALVGDGQQRPEIEKLVADLRIASHVHLLGLREDIPELLHEADAFMLSSLSEGISVTLLEAMAAERPIVATAVGGNAEVVEHGRTGLLSPRQDPTTLAHNLTALLQSPPLRRRMGAAGRHRLLQHFTQQQMHHAYAELYRRILA